MLITLMELILQTIELANDPYIMHDHVGKHECKLCLNIAYYLRGKLFISAHGKEHQIGLAYRAATEVKLARQEGNGCDDAQ